MNLGKEIKAIKLQDESKVFIIEKILLFRLWKIGVSMSIFIRVFIFIFLSLTLVTQHSYALTFEEAEAVYNWQDYSKSKTMYEELIKQYTKESGKNSAEVFKARLGVATCLRGEGKYKDALKQIEQIYKESEKVLGKNHRITLKSKFEIGVTYHYLGRFSEIFTLLNEVLLAQNAAFGRSDLDTLETVSVMGAAMFAVGEQKEAHKAWTSMLPTTQKSLGEYHELTLWTRVNIAITTSFLGKPKEALDMYLAVMPLVEEKLGKYHMLTANLYSNLAVTYARLGKPAEEKIYAEKARVLQNKHASDNPQTLLFRYQEAVTLDNAGKYQEAKKELQSILPLQEKAFGRENVHTLRTATSLAILSSKLGEYNEAKKLLNYVLQVAPKSLGEKHDVVLSAKEALATMQYEQGDFKSSSKLLSEVKDAYEEKYGADHEYTLMSENKLSNMIDYTKDTKPPTIDTLKKLEEKYGEDHPSVLKAWANYAIDLNTNKRTKEAIEILKKVYEKNKAIQGKNHSDTLVNAINLATLYAAIENTTEAKRLYDEIIPELIKVYGKEHPLVLTATGNLASIQADKGDYAKSLENQIIVYETFKKTKGESHNDTLTAVNNLATTYSTLGDHRKAIELLEGAVIAINNADVNNSEIAKVIKLNLEAIITFESSLTKSNTSLSSSKNSPALTKVAIAELEEKLKKNNQEYGEYSLKSLEVLAQIKNLEFQSSDFYSKDFQNKDFTSYDKQFNDFLGRILLSQNNADFYLRSHLGTFSGLKLLAGSHRVGTFFSKIAILALREQREKNIGLQRDLQQTFHESQTLFYELPIRGLILQERFQEALMTVNLLKENELEDATYTKLNQSGIEKDYLTPTEYKLYREYMAWSNRLYSLGEEYFPLYSNKTSLNLEETKRLTSIESEIRMVRNLFTKFLTTIEKRLEEEEYDVKAIANQNYENLKSILEPIENGIFIHIVTSNDLLHLFMTNKTAVAAYSIRIPKKFINELVNEFYADLTNPNKDPRKSSKALYDVLLLPMEELLENLNIEHILFSLDGSLRYVPMSALYDGKKWLAEKFTITMFTDVVRESYKSEPSDNGKVSAMGLTNAIQGFSGLPSVEKELNVIVKGSNPYGILEGKKYLNNAFTEKQFLESIKSKNPIIHIATHFHFDPVEQKNSFLLLGDGSKLTTGEMFWGNPISLQGVDLLTLSACDTASGVKNGDGREVESFAVLAQKNGAKAVLASLWPVVDNSTASFMQEFYARNALDKESKSEALAQSQRMFINKEINGENSSENRSQRGKIMLTKSTNEKNTNSNTDWSHPYYWAPFQLMGNWK